MITETKCRIQNYLQRYGTFFFFNLAVSGQQEPEEVKSTKSKFISVIENTFNYVNTFLRLTFALFSVTSQTE